jgi:hypothetical protein
MVGAISTDIPSTLKDVIRDVESWPAEDQKELLDTARNIRARRTGVYMLADDERVAVREGLAQADRGEFASEEDIEALWKRNGV